MAINSSTPPTPKEYRWAVFLEFVAFGKLGELLFTCVIPGTTMDDDPQAFALLHAMRVLREFKGERPDAVRIDVNASALRSDSPETITIPMNELL